MRKSFQPSQVQNGVLEFALNGVDLGRGRGGNESYLQGLIAALADEPSVKALHVFVGQHFTCPQPQAKTHFIQTGPYRRLPYLLWQQSLALRRIRYDWFLSTFFLPAFTPRRCALFVHDLSFLSLPGSYPLSIRLYMRLLVSWAVRRAKVIFVLSEFVRGELKKFFRTTDSSKVFVLYPGYNQDFRAVLSPDDAQRLARHALTPGYILSVSNIHPRKNLVGLLEAYRFLKDRERVPPLIIVGQRYWGDSTLEDQVQANGARLLGYVEQADLPAIYRGAQIFIYPSIYEGFGLPPLEAMASGVPVVCGQHTSLPEVVGDAALMVDVQQPQQIAHTLARLLNEQSLRETLTQKGLQRAKQFGWPQTARRLVTILNQALSR